MEEALGWDFSVTEPQLAELYSYLYSLLEDDRIEPNSVMAATGDILSIQTNDADNQAMAKKIYDKVQAILEEYKMR